MSTPGIVDNVTELGALGLVKDATAEVQVHPTARLVKLNLINNEESFCGLYPVREHVLSLGDEPQANLRPSWAGTPSDPLSPLDH